jgi:acyl dehydratase
LTAAPPAESFGPQEERHDGPHAAGPDIAPQALRRMSGATPPMADGDAPRLLGLGFHWQDLAVGQRFRTFRRTVTEADLMGFVALTGMQEPLFVDATHAGALGARPVPAALTHALIEGMLLRGMVHGTGLALLETRIRALAPVRVGDSVDAVAEVTAVRPTSRGGRAVVACLVRVANQRGEAVMEYEVTRLLAGRDTGHGGDETA